jgi:hypothetical protein
MNIKDFTFISGGAKGSDTRWKTHLEELGAKFIEYTPDSLNELSEEDYSNVEQNYMEVISRLGRNYIPDSIYSGLLVRRDMLQANSASQVIAIAPIEPLGYVMGGTGYSTTRAIILGLPVYVFDLTDNCWKFWDRTINHFRYYPSVPELIDKTCLVGTRQLTDEGRTAMDKVIENFKLKYGKERIN